MPDAGETVDHYEVLGLTQQATIAEIKRAFRTLALRFHPDKNGGSPEATVQFQDLARSYEVSCLIRLLGLRAYPHHRSSLVM
jgi:curved DNA-binding protein CbpA